MSRDSRLHDEASKFASLLSDLLNATVCTGVELQSLVVEETDELELIAVGAGLSEDKVKPDPVPLSLAEDEDERDAASLWLTLDYRLMMDDYEGRYLTVHTSSFGLCVNPKTYRPAVRIEFDREKRSYPAAHVQVHGASEEFGYAWAAAGIPPKSLADVHIPVGGLRYRPCLEDFIEFLVDEGFVADTHDGWRDELIRSRDEFHAIQLRAAIRRDPATALDVLADYVRVEDGRVVVEVPTEEDR